MKNKQKLLSLIEELNLPISPEEALFHMRKMSEEEISSLIPSFEYVLDYQNNLSKEAEHADPDRYALAEATYQKELRELHENFLNKLEVVQKEYDDEMDAVEEKTAEELEQIIRDEEKELEKLEKEYIRLSSKLSAK